MKTTKRIWLSVLLLVSLVATIAMTGVSCSDNTVGSGEQTFSITVVNSETSKEYTVATDQTTVGDALYENGLIDGKEDGYVTTVDGVTCDWNTDGTYWAFYVNDEYAMTGVYDTEIHPDDTYKLEVTKG